jgi:hypothetical protein
MLVVYRMPIGMVIVPSDVALHMKEYVTSWPATRASISTMMLLPDTLARLALIVIPGLFGIFSADAAIQTLSAEDWDMAGIATRTAITPANPTLISTLTELDGAPSLRTLRPIALHSQPSPHGKV